jgi:regulatory protein
MKKFSRNFVVPTPESLARAAFSYLGRYAASESSLRRALHNRLRRAALAHPAFAQDAEKQAALRDVIEKIIEKHRMSGVLNDAAYAETKVNSLRRAGRSRRFIEFTLSRKGVHADLTHNALTETDGDGGDPAEAEMKAARAFARRRKLGPFRAGTSDENRRRKDLATLARAGFSLDVAKKALSAVFDEYLEDNLL